MKHVHPGSQNLKQYQPKSNADPSATPVVLPSPKRSLQQRVRSLPDSVRATLHHLIHPMDG